MISILSARRLWAQWQEENDPATFLRSNGVKGDGKLSQYHCISISVETGNIFYRQAPEIDEDDLIVDVVVMGDWDNFDVVEQLSIADCLQIIADQYFKFRDRQVMTEIPIHKVPIFRRDSFVEPEIQPENIEFNFPVGTTGRMHKFNEK